MTAGEFFSWWVGQLRELIPERFLKLWQRARVTITLCIESNRSYFVIPSGNTTVKFPVPQGDAPETPAELERLLAALPSPPQRLRILFAPNQHLVRHFTLPRAAKPHLAEAVGYQLPKIIPFTADQVLYACGATPDGSADGPLQVWVAAVPRERVTRALSVIGQTPPDNPISLSSPPQIDEPLAMSWAISEPTKSPQRRLRLAWIGLAVAWIAALGLHLYNRYDTRDQLEFEVSQLRQEAAGTSEIRDRLAAAQAQLEWLAQRRQTTTSSIVLLDSLAQLFDDQTWLQHLTLNGDELILRGFSSSPSSLVETLENSETLEAVRIAAFTRDRRSQADRFNISAKVEKPAQDDASATDANPAESDEI